MLGKSNRLLIVARAGRALAQAAREAGLVPLVIDLCGDIDTRMLAHVAVTLMPSARFDFNAAELEGAIAAMQTFNGPLPIVYGSGFEGAPAVLAKLSRHYRMLGCDASVHRRLLDPPALFKILRRDLGIAVPPTTWQAPRKRDAWLVKRAGASGGGHVRLAVAGERGLARRYFQRRIMARSQSALLLANGEDVRLLGITEHLRWHEHATFRYEGARTVANPPAALVATVTRIAQQLTRALALRGLFGIDFLHADDGRVWLVDINARPTATLDLWPERGRMLRAHVAACTAGTLLYSSPQHRDSHAHLVLYADANWPVPSDIRWPSWTADRPRAATTIAHGAPLCTLYAAAATPQALAEVLARRYQALRRRLGAAAAAVLPAAISIRIMGRG